MEGAKQEMIRNLDSVGQGLSNGLSKIFREILKEISQRDLILIARIIGIQVVK